MTPAPDSLPHYPADVQHVQVGDYRTAYVDRGDGPVLLFVHGLGSNLSLWRTALDTFAETHRVVALDLPGFGLSEKADVPATMPFFAQHVAAFMDTLGIARATYVGVSMGGQVGLTLALSAEARVARMVLVSPAGIEQFTAEEAATLKQLTTPQAIAQSTDAQVAQSVRANFDTWSPKHQWLIEQRHALAQRDDFSAYAAANARAVAGMLDGAVYDRLDTLSMPMLVLFGAGDRLIPNPYLHPEQTIDDVADGARAALPSATVTVVEDAGHLLMLERPAAFRTHVRPFLQQTRTP